MFNGEKYLRAALDSILAQSYKDFELVISDNASTDNTQQICREYTRRDSRVRYYRNRKNLGACRNFNRVFALSCGEYFKWAHSDDLHAPDYLSKCIKVLDRDPSIVLCNSAVGKINQFGEVVGKYDIGVKIDYSTPHERFGAMINLKNSAWLLIHGLMRASSLRQTRLFGYYYNADRNLLAEMFLIGSIFQISETLFFRRVHSESFTDRNNKDLRWELMFWTNSIPGKLVFPGWRTLLEYFNSVRHMRLKRSESERCYRQIGKWFLSEGWVVMFYDIESAIEHLRPGFLRKIHLPAKLRVLHYL